MGDFVCDGTEFTCPFCTSSLKLSVDSSAALGEEKTIANLTNCFFPPPGGMCLPRGVPCVPDVQVADPGQNILQISGKKALGVDCKFSCCHGGTAKVANPAQGTAQHVKPSPPKPPPKLEKCSIIQQKVFHEAVAVKDGPYVKYSHSSRLGPNSYDCSGFVSKMYEKAEAPFGHPSVAQIVTFLVGPNRPFKTISLSEAKAGDLIVWLQIDNKPPKGVHPAPFKPLTYDHIGIYDGKGYVISSVHDHPKKHESSVRSIKLEYLPDYSHITQPHVRSYRVISYRKCIE